MKPRSTFESKKYRGKKLQLKERVLIYEGVPAVTLWEEESDRPLKKFE